MNERYVWKQCSLCANQKHLDEYRVTQEVPAKYKKRWWGHKLIQEVQFVHESICKSCEALSEEGQREVARKRDRVFQVTGMIIGVKTDEFGDLA